MDSERIITRPRAEGYALSRRHEGADVVVVNTCGFLDSAKAESLAAISEALSERAKRSVLGACRAHSAAYARRDPSRDARTSSASLSSPESVRACDDPTSSAMEHAYHEDADFW